MTQLPEPLDPLKAETIYGVSTQHELMPWGELRFRLRAQDGTAYIRTIAPPRGAWQNSHLHRTAHETYIVQAGWFAIAYWRDGVCKIERHGLGAVVTVGSMDPHNVYLPAGAVLHTIRHGNGDAGDWIACPVLDEHTKHMQENELIEVPSILATDVSRDTKYDAYVSIYNNLDNLLWRIPVFFVAVASLFVASIGGVASRPDSAISHTIWAVLFAFGGILFVIGAYSMGRIRRHHSLMGAQLQAMESSGYFHARARAVRAWWPPSAPSVFIALFSLLGFACLGLAYAAWRHPYMLAALLA